MRDAHTREALRIGMAQNPQEYAKAIREFLEKLIEDADEMKTLGNREWRDKLHKTGRTIVAMHAEGKKIEEARDQLLEMDEAWMAAHQWIEIGLALRDAHNRIGVCLE